MRRFLPLPVFVFGFACVAVPTSQADDFASYQTVAKGWRIEQNCTHLSSPEHDELGSYAVATELAIIGTAGADRVRKVIEESSATAQAVACGPATERQVSEALAEGRSFAERKKAVAAAPAPAPRRPRRSVAAATPDPADSEVRSRLVEGEREVGLRRFEAQAEAYLVERRCRHLDYRDAPDFWELVVERQKAMIRQFGTRAVSVAKRRAEAAAAQTTVCTPATRRLVQTGYANARRYAGMR